MKRFLIMVIATTLVFVLCSCGRVVESEEDMPKSSNTIVTTVDTIEDAKSNSVVDAHNTDTAPFANENTFMLSATEFEVLEAF